MRSKLHTALSQCGCIPTCSKYRSVSTNANQQNLPSFHLCQWEVLGTSQQPARCTLLHASGNGTSTRRNSLAVGVLGMPSERAFVLPYLHLLWPQSQLHLSSFHNQASHLERTRLVRRNPSLLSHAPPGQSKVLSIQLPTTMEQIHFKLKK